MRCALVTGVQMCARPFFSIAGNSHRATRSRYPPREKLRAPYCLRCRRAVIYRKGIITLFSQPTAAAALSGQSNPLHGDFEGRSLQCRRGGRDVFAGLDFALPPGVALLLTGPNGSGKSSLLRLMAGLLRPAAGQLLLAGRPIPAAPDRKHDGWGKSGS